MTLRFNPQVLTPDFQIITTSVTLGTTRVRICGADPNRVLLAPLPRSGGTVVISPDPLVTTTEGFQVNFAQAPWALDFGTYGPIVSGEWWGIASVAAFPFKVIQLIYRPERG